MTAPAAAPVSGVIAAPAPRIPPQPATDRFAFAAMLDSIPGGAAKAASSTAEEGSHTSNPPKEGQSPAGRPDGHPMLGDGAFLSSLPFAVPSALAAGQGPAPTVDASLLELATTEGPRRETGGASNTATAEPAKPAAARLTGERAFHLALSTPSVVGSAGALSIDGPSVTLSPADGESEAGAPRPSNIAPLATPSRALAEDARISRAIVAAASLSPTGVAPGPGAAAAMSPAAAPIAPRAAGGQANPPLSPVRAAAPDPARGGRKGEVAASLSPGRSASPAVASAKTEPDKADANPSDSAPTGQLATPGAVFGAPPSASVAPAPSFAPSEARGAVEVTSRASAPAPAQAAPAAPVKEIDVDLSPSGLENISMTMRLAGEKLTVVIRAASSQTAGSIEGVRDAISDRLAAIGQPLDSLIIRQTGVNGDANANGNGASADDGSTGGGRQSKQGGSEQWSSGDANSSRRGPARNRSF